MHKTTSLRQKIYNIIQEDLEVISKDIYFVWAAINKQIILREERLFLFSFSTFIFLLNLMRRPKENKRTTMKINIS